MELLAKTSDSEIATVYIGKLSGGKVVEFVESVQPPVPKSEKWVLIISTMSGCPVGCSFCDSGYFYEGKLTDCEMLEQISQLVDMNFPGRQIPVKKFKIQFSRMGEPALNMGVTAVLKDFDSYFDAPGFIPSISTVAPKGCDLFFDRLLDIKQKKYTGRMQLQFSLHSTDETQRDLIIPIRKWKFKDIAGYGESFFSSGDKKITLNFALSKIYDFNPEILSEYFNPEIFLIKLTPVNPTISAISKGILPIDFGNADIVRNIREELDFFGFESIVSFGEPEENKIGSNCGLAMRSFLERGMPDSGSYTYPMYNLT